MPDPESAVRALPLAEAGAKGNEIKCIRYNDGTGYYYGELYPRDEYSDWEVGDRQQ